jgi:hypothetical protein
LRREPSEGIEALVYRRIEKSRFVESRQPRRVG